MRPLRFHGPSLRALGRLPRQSGFTLLEIMVALAIFAVLYALAIVAVQVVLDGRQSSDARLERIGALQVTFRFLQNDINQVIRRPVRDELGEVLPALRGGGIAPRYHLELTRGGWFNPLGQPRPSLRRVAWRVAEERLERLTWDVLDPVSGTEPHLLPLLEEVERMEIRFLDEEGKWHTAWPPLDENGTPLADRLPVAVEVTLELTDMGRVQRLMLAAGG